MLVFQIAIKRACCFDRNGKFSERKMGTPARLNDVGVGQE